MSEKRILPDQAAIQEFLNTHFHLHDAGVEEVIYDQTSQELRLKLDEIYQPDEVGWFKPSDEKLEICFSGVADRIAGQLKKTEDYSFVSFEFLDAYTIEYSYAYGIGKIYFDAIHAIVTPVA